VFLIHLPLQYLRIRFNNLQIVNLSMKSPVVKAYSQRIRILIMLFSVAFCLKCTQATYAAAVYEHGKFTVTSGATNDIDISHSLGVTPKAIIVYGTQSAGADETPTTHADFFIGFSDGTTSRCISYRSDNAAGTSVATSWLSDSLAEPHTNAGSVFTVNLDSFGSSSFRIDIPDGDAATPDVNYILIGGSEISAKVVEWDNPTTGTFKSVTGVGFQPDVVMNLMTRANQTTLNTAHGHAGACFGVMTSEGEQWTTALFSYNSQGTSITSKAQRTNKALMSISGTSTLDIDAQYASMDSDGFTLKYNALHALSSKVFSLALKGLQVKASSFNKANTSTTQDVTVGFQPGAVLFSNVSTVTSTSVPDHGVFSFGAATGASNEGAISVFDQDNLDTTNAYKYMTDTGSIVTEEDYDSSVETRADLTSFGADKFTITWDNTNKVTDSLEICYLAFGSATSSGYTWQQAGFKSGSFVKTSSNNTEQTITHSLGKMPKAIIFYGTNGTTTGTFVSDAKYFFGISSGFDTANNRSVSLASDDGVTTTNASRRHSNTPIAYVTWGEALESAAEMVSWDENNFTIKWTTNTASTDYIINYMVIGGSETVKAKIVGWNTLSATGDKSVTGAGFRPDAVVHISTPTLPTDTTLPATNASGLLAMGVMDRRGNQWANMLYTQDALTTTTTTRVQVSDQTFVRVKSDEVIEGKAAFKSMDSDGFTVNFSQSPTATGFVSSLCLKGVTVKAGKFNKDNSGTNGASQNVSVGFQPSAVLFSTTQTTSNAAGVASLRYGLGTVSAANGTTSRSVLITDTDGLGTSSVDAVTLTNKSMTIMNANSTTTEAEGDVTEHYYDGFSMTWSKNNAVATEICYLAFAPEGTPYSTRLSSVQNGTLTMASSDLSETVTLGTSVTMTKAFLVFSVKSTGDGPQTCSVTGKISATNELTFQRASTFGSTDAIDIEWYVAEFSSGVTVQRGSSSFSNSTSAVTNNVTITSVDRNKAVPIISMRAGYVHYSAQDYVKAKLTSSTNLELYRAATAIGYVTYTVTVEWQVIEFDDAIVSTGDVAISTAETSDTGTIDCPDTSKCWLLYSYDSTDGTSADIAQRAIRGYISSSTTATFDRATTGVTATKSAHNITWYLVKFTDSTNVISGTSSFTTSDLTKDVTLSPTVNTSWCIAMAGIYGAQSQTSGPADNDGNKMGHGLVTLDLTSSSNLRLTRSLGTTSGKTSTAATGYYVIQFPSGTTDVKLESFSASRHPNGTLLQWRTEYETDNLGFHIYREVNGRRVRITRHPVPGSALVKGRTYDLDSGKSYKWRDANPPESYSDVKYYLEDLDINGHTTLHGPVTPQLHNQMLVERPGSAAAVFSTSEVSTAVSSLNSNNYFGDPASEPSINSTKLQSQFSVAAQRALKIVVDKTGIYRVTRDQLISAGLNPTVSPRFLQLYVDGEQVPMIVSGERDGRLDSSDYIEFYARNLSTPTTTERTYWLVSSNRLGKRINPETRETQDLERRSIPVRRPVRITASLSASTRVAYGTSYPYTVERADKNIYFSGFLNGDEENFFGPVVSSTPVEQNLTLKNVDTSVSDYATLEISLVGVTSMPGEANDHNVVVKVNGQTAGAITYDGRIKYSKTLNIPHGWLQDGLNTITLQSTVPPSDMSLVDRVKLTYMHKPVADSNTLYFKSQGGRPVQISGFTSPGVRIFDITTPDDAQEIKGVITRQVSAGNYQVTSTISTPGERTLVAFTSEAIKSPSITQDTASTLNSRSNRADQVIISHRDFISKLTPLKELRESRGLKVNIVDIQDVYDEFGFGAKSPAAIRRFLAHTKSSWATSPRFVLFVGDATFDPLNRLGLGAYDFVPTHLVDTRTLETSSDDSLADFDGDGLAEMAVGRLPARTALDAERMVQKIIKHEQGGLTEGVLFMTDRDDTVNKFEMNSSMVRSAIPASMPFNEIRIGQMTVSAARQELLSSLSAGKLVVNYNGHGSVGVWARGGMFTTSIASTLTNQQRPLFIAMNCLNGYYHDIYSESMAEALIKSRDGGAVAVWASSGMTEMTEQVRINQQFYNHLFGPRQLTLGEIINKAKASTPDKDVRRTWIFFGDPAMYLK
jgi:hypothetical protein